MRAVCLALLLLACHHDEPPVKPEPTEHAPLPPASGTPIGYLIDAAVDLKLTDDQVATLRDIDNSLAAELESIDAQMRGTGAPRHEDAPPSGGGRHGMRGGGMGGRHHRGGGAPAQGAGSGSASPSHAADLSRLTEQRAGDVRDAIARALAALDDAQQAKAKQILDDKGVDVDAGRPPPQEPAEP